MTEKNTEGNFSRQAEFECIRREDLRREVMKGVDQIRNGQGIRVKN